MCQYILTLDCITGASCLPEVAEAGLLTDGDINIHVRAAGSSSFLDIILEELRRDGSTTEEYRQSSVLYLIPNK